MVNLHCQTLNEHLEKGVLLSNKRGVPHFFTLHPIHVKIVPGYCGKKML